MKSLTLFVLVSTSDNRFWLIIIVIIKHRTANADDNERSIRKGRFLIVFSIITQRKNKERHLVATLIMVIGIVVAY